MQLTRLFTEHKPSQRPKSQPKLIQDSHPDFWINPDSDPEVCQIAPKMLQIHYYAGVSRFAECRENWHVTVSEMVRNVLKSPIPQWWGKWKSEPESASGTTSPVHHQKVNQFF